MLTTTYLPVAAATTPFSVVFILFFVALCVAIGIISSIAAFFCLRNENAELDKIRKREDEVNAKWLESILKNGDDKLNEKKLGRNLALRRLQLIRETLYGNEGTQQAKAIQPPHMNDLHNLTEQAIMCSKPATFLRITTSVLLIIGICGTLWGVHSVIDRFSENVNTKDFAPALLPSAIAVFFTIVLLTLRGFYLMAADRFLYKLDRETMVRWLPSLIPSAGVDTEITAFAKAINQFNTEIKNNMEPLSLAPKDVKKTSDEMYKIISNLKDIDTKLRTKLEKAINPACEALENQRQEIENGLNTTKMILSQARESLAWLKNLNTHLTEQTKSYEESMATTRTLIEGNRNKLKAATEQSIQLKESIDKMNQNVTQLGDITGNAKELNTTLTSTTQQMDTKSADFTQAVQEAVKCLNDTKGQITSINEHTSLISQRAQEIEDASNEAKTAADIVNQKAADFTANLEKYDEDIKNERAQMVRAREELEAKSTTIEKTLESILTGAQQLQERIISPVGFLERLSEGLSKTPKNESSPRKRP